MKEYTKKEVVELVKELEKLIKDKGLLEPEFEVGKLYVSKGGSLAIYQSEDSGYGFEEDGLGLYTGLFHFNQPNLWTKASELENDLFKGALIEEAKSRGYKDGNYKSLTGGNTYSHNDDYTVSNGKVFTGLGCGANIVFKNGKWAEITEEKEEVFNSSILNQVNDRLKAIEEKLSKLTGEELTIK